jgi:hypothetical protein
MSRGRLARQTGIESRRAFALPWRDCAPFGDYRIIRSRGR